MTNAFPDFIPGQATVEALDPYAFIDRISTVRAGRSRRTNTFIFSLAIDTFRAVEAGIWITFINILITFFTFPTFITSTIKTVEIIIALSVYAWIRIALVDFYRTVSTSIS